MIDYLAVQKFQVLVAWIILAEKVFVCMSDIGYMDEKNRCWIRRKQ